MAALDGKGKMIEFDGKIGEKAWRPLCQVAESGLFVLYGVIDMLQDFRHIVIVLANVRRIFH